MLGPGDFVAEGTSVLSDDSYIDTTISTDDTKFVRISYDDIVDGKVLLCDHFPTLSGVFQP